MPKRKTIILITLVVMILGLFSSYILAYVVRERSIADLPYYYKEAARRECGVVWVLFPLSGCLNSVRMSARDGVIISDNGKCPEGYAAVGVACGPGCVGVCHPWPIK